MTKGPMFFAAVIIAVAAAATGATAQQDAQDCGWMSDVPRGMVCRVLIPVDTLKRLQKGVLYFEFHNIGARCVVINGVTTGTGTMPTAAPNGPAAVSCAFDR